MDVEYMRQCLTEKEAAHYIGMSVAFLKKDRCEGKIGNRTIGPKYLKIGKSVRYLKEDLDIWLKNFCQKTN